MNDYAGFAIEQLGPCQTTSPLVGYDDAADTELRFVPDDQRILLEDRLDGALDRTASLQLAGPRKNIFFDPATTRIGIVTCGGLCPGLNDVVRGLVMTAWHRYGVSTIFGFRYGYRGLAGRHVDEALRLTPEVVSDIHEKGGSILGSSRGKQDLEDVADTLARLGINVLFVIGGDGTLRGALALSEVLRRRAMPVAVVGIPKTIDNDILYLDRSFGFVTAYTRAVEAILAAHNEARGTPNGVGLVKLMGRYSGSIACQATLATSHVNFTLIPEIPFRLQGANGFLESLRRRLLAREHAVVVVAEGAGQDFFADHDPGRDASGNVKLHDIGPYLCEQIRRHISDAGMESSLKYIDPSYIVRGLPACPADSVYCWRLAQNAVHAAMCGKTEMVIGQWHGRLVHVPMRQAIADRKQVDPHGDIWLSVLESTGQPFQMH